MCDLKELPSCLGALAVALVVSFAFAEGAEMAESTFSNEGASLDGREISADDLVSIPSSFGCVVPGGLDVLPISAVFCKVGELSTDVARCGVGLEVDNEDWD